MMVTRKLTAWLAHCYTALGLVAAAGMAVFIVRGDAESFRRAIALMIVATFIDSTDGWLARRARVKEILPRFDGRRLDDIIDFQTYTSLPLLFIWRAGILPAGLSWWLGAALLASVYGFSQSNAKTSGAKTSGAKTSGAKTSGAKTSDVKAPDAEAAEITEVAPSAQSAQSGEHFFVGFPSYWNVVAIYLYWLRPPVWLTLALIITLALLTFVPSLYLYSARGGRLSRLTNLLCVVWGVLLALIVAGAFDNPKPFVWASLALPIYYFVVSWAITLERWFGGRRRKSGADFSLPMSRAD